jgi:hypothetical protein
MSRAPLEPKPCEFCRKMMKPKAWHKPCDWAAQKFCTRACSSKSRAIPLTARLMAHSIRNAATGCLEWIGSRGPKGYGYISPNETGEAVVSRVAWALEHGPIPDGLHVLHTCDNPPCFDTAHLYLGTNDDNARDRRERGRSVSAPGEANGRAKITAADVAAIRTDRRLQRIIATEYGIGQSQVSAIKVGASWKQ